MIFSRHWKKKKKKIKLTKIHLTENYKITQI